MLQSSPSAPQARERAWIVGLSIALGIYSLVVGIAFLAGSLSTARVPWLLAPVPFVLACWYGYGFLQPSNPPLASTAASGTSSPDLGLLCSAGGWALVVLALLAPSPTTGNNITASFCGVLAVLCILCGAALSWRSWNEKARQQSDNI